MSELDLTKPLCFREQRDIRELVYIGPLPNRKLVFAVKITFDEWNVFIRGIDGRVSEGSEHGLDIINVPPKPRTARRLVIMYTTTGGGIATTSFYSEGEAKRWCKHLGYELIASKWVTEGEFAKEEPSDER
jgi:hypothetical protein